MGHEPELLDIKQAAALLQVSEASLRRWTEAGRLVLSEYAVSAAAQLEFWNTRFGAATRAGAHSLRVVGDVSGGRLARQSPFEEVLEYETEYDRSVSRRFPVDTLCLYDARALSGVEAARLLEVHPEVLRYPGYTTER